MKNLIIYFIFRIFTFFVNILPKSVNKYFARGFGKLAYFLTKSRRQIAKKNIKNALGKNMTDKEIDEMVKKVYENIGFMLVEFILLKKINKSNYENFINIKGYENFIKAMNEEKGVIIYSAHFGNWEWLAAFISLMGFPLNAIAQEQHNSYFDRYINDLREEKGINVIKLGISVRNAYNKLKKGECVFILGDQDARHKGWKLNFFSQPASTYHGVIQLAERTGALIVPTFLIRKEFTKHQLVFYPARKIENGMDQKEKKKALQKLNNLTEKVIKDHKNQWFWLHKRWKSY